MILERTFGFEETQKNSLDFFRIQAGKPIPAFDERGRGEKIHKPWSTPVVKPQCDFPVGFTPRRPKVSHPLPDLSISEVRESNGEFNQPPGIEIESLILIDL